MNLKALLPGNLHTREPARERVRYKSGRDALLAEGNVQASSVQTAAANGRRRSHSLVMVKVD